MKRKVDYINIELLIHPSDGRSICPYLVSKKYAGKLEEKDVLFAEATSDLVFLLENLGFDCSLRCSTYSDMEEIDL